MFDEAQKAEIAALIAKVPTESARQRLTGELEILASRYAAADAAGDSAQKTEIEARLHQLRRDAEIAAQVSLWSTFSMIFAGGVAVAYFRGIVLYLRGLGAPEYAAVEATRAVLVFTLIAAMLAFGGLLIVRPLFSTEEATKLRERFRLSREIFMVFAGTFSTIIGFYFGTAQATPADPPSLSAPVYVEGTLTVEVAGGRPPFEVLFRASPAGGGVPMGPVSGEDRTFSYRVPGTACPADGSVEVTDGDGRHDQIEVTCPDESEGENESEPAENQSETNNVADGG